MISAGSVGLLVIGPTSAGARKGNQGIRGLAGEATPETDHLQELTTEDLLPARVAEVTQGKWRDVKADVSFARGEDTSRLIAQNGVAQTCLLAVTMTPAGETTAWNEAMEEMGPRPVGTTQEVDHLRGTVAAARETTLHTKRDAGTTLRTMRGAGDNSPYYERRRERDYSPRDRSPVHHHPRRYERDDSRSPAHYKM